MIQCNIYSFILVGPEMWFDGPNRTEFQDILRRVTETYASRVNDDDRVEDIYQALDFYYTPWPYLHDKEKNRHALGEVNNIC